MKATPGSSPQSERGVESIAEGDRAAAHGDWPRAVGIWHLMLESDQRGAATQRIRWFLGEADSGGVGEPGLRWTGHGSRVALSVAFVCGMFATLAVLVAQGVGDAAAMTLASVAWLLYAFSASLAVAYAWRTGRPSGQLESRLTPEEITRSAELAVAIGTAEDDDPENREPSVRI